MSFHISSQILLLFASCVRGIVSGAGRVSSSISKPEFTRSPSSAIIKSLEIRRNSFSSAPSSGAFSTSSIVSFAAGHGVVTLNHLLQG